MTTTTQQTGTSLAGRVALITGGASGIGAATVREFLAQGARVMVVDLDVAVVEAFVAPLAAVYGGDRIRGTVADVARFEQVQSMVAETRAAWGRVDILFNNAGIGCIGEVPDVPLEKWQRTIAVDLDAVFYACREVIPLMRAQGGGVIINTASVSGMAGDYGFSAYSAAKAAVINLTRTMALDHARDGIRVNALCPGLVATPLISGAIASERIGPHWTKVIPMGRPAQPEEMARAVRFMASDDASYMTGTTLVIDGGMTAWTGQPDILGLLGKRG